MKLRLFLLILVAVHMTSAAGATSLAKVSENQIRKYIAEIRASGFYCKEFNLRHNMLDLIWDVLELKTGKDPNDDSEVEINAAIIEPLVLKFKADLRQSCANAYARFGPDGSAIRDVIYRK